MKLILSPALIQTYLNAQMKNVTNKITLTFSPVLLKFWVTAKSFAILHLESSIEFGSFIRLDDSESRKLVTES